MRKFLIIIAFLSGLAVCSYWSYGLGWWRFNEPSWAAYPVRGLDVSHHQGDIDWARVPKDRFRFVYIKATEGGDHRDSKFDYNWNAAFENGFETGAYHFYTLCRDGREQARNFMNAAPKRKDALAPAIDLEFVGNCAGRPEKEEFLEGLRLYAEAVGRHYGQRPVLYTTYAFYRRYLAGSEFGDYPLWVRGIFGEPDRGAFPRWRLWQYADNLRVPGIETRVDANIRAP